MKKTIGIIIGIILGLLVCSLFGSCKTKERIVYESRVDTLRTVAIQKDSIYKLDSIYVREWMKGDTVFIDKTKWQMMYKDRIVKDTVYVSKVKEVEKIVKEKQPWWIRYSGWLTLAIFIIVAGGCLWFDLRRKQ